VSAPATYERLVAEFKRAKHVYETSQIGSVKGDRAYQKMTDLVERAEDNGYLDSFVADVTR
jgi:hypothetical protein